MEKYCHLLVLGSRNIGKTFLCNKLHNIIEDNILSSYGIDIKESKTHNLKKYEILKTYELNFDEIKILENFQIDFNFVFLCFDSTNIITLKNLKKKYEFFQKEYFLNSKFIFIGLKTDILTMLSSIEIKNILLKI